MNSELKCWIRGYHRWKFHYEHPNERWHECRDCHKQEEQRKPEKHGWFRVRVLGFCEHCRRHWKYPRRRRQNTAYVNDESNFVTVCRECFDDIEERWDELWAEYYSGRM